MRLRPGVAIDLGTVNTLVYVAGRGLVVDEPSAIAIDRATGKVAAIGAMAEALSGKEPEGIEVVWPLRDGVIADVVGSTLMLNMLLRRARLHRGLLRTAAVICVPRSATAVERRAVETSVEGRNPHCVVRLLDEAVAASIGAGAEASSGKGIFVVDVGGGTTEIAVVAGGGVVRGRSLRVGGNAMDQSIARFVKERLGLRLGLNASEQLKIALGLTGGEEGSATTVGIDLGQEELRTEHVPGEIVAAALERPVAAIVDAIHDVLAGVPPDLADDVVTGGVHLAGGGALLLGLADRIEQATGITTSLVEDPLRCVVRGAVAILEHGDHLGASKAA